MEVSSSAIQPTTHLQEHLPLLQQAQGLPRRDVMKDVVGPALTELFQPIYEPSFSDDEVGELPDATTFADVGNLVWGIERILKNRLEARIDERGQLYDEFEELRNGREELFFDNGLVVKGLDFWANLEDAINSGVMAPLVVAVDILRLENGEERGSHSEILDGPVDYQALAAIMKRDSFWRILNRLSKGPNGYLTGERSSPRDAFSPWSWRPSELSKADSFFGFKKGSGDYRQRDRLSIWDAYRMENGQVVDLSYDFFQSAKQQRAEVSKRGAMVFSRGKHRGENSSGCPVRHTFDGYSESLIARSKEFLIAALEAAEIKAAEAQAAAQLEQELHAQERPHRLQKIVGWLLRPPT